MSIVRLTAEVEILYDPDANAAVINFADPGPDSHYYLAGDSRGPSAIVTYTACGQLAQLELMNAENQIPQLIRGDRAPDPGEDGI